MSDWQTRFPRLAKHADRMTGVKMCGLCSECGSNPVTECVHGGLTLDGDPFARGEVLCRACIEARLSPVGQLDLFVA